MKTKFDRRGIVGGAAALTIARAIPAIARETGMEAIGFDGFVIFDPRTVTNIVRKLVPDKGDALASAWIIRLFGYSWVVTAAEHYQNFEVLADAALRVTAESLHIDLRDPIRRQIIDAFSHLDPWPDVASALAKLRAAGIKLAFLSNLTEAMLRSSMEYAGITDAFDQVLSTDRVSRFKPSPAAYHMGETAFGLPRDAIGFAAFGGWDAVGATWYGYKTAWINRLGAPRDPLAPPPTVVASGIEGVLTLAGLG